MFPTIFLQNPLNKKTLEMSSQLKSLNQTIQQREQYPLSNQPQLYPAGRGGRRKDPDALPPGVTVDIIDRCRHPFVWKLPTGYLDCLGGEARRGRNRSQKRDYTKKEGQRRPTAISYIWKHTVNWRHPSTRKTQQGEQTWRACREAVNHLTIIGKGSNSIMLHNKYLGQRGPP